MSGDTCAIFVMSFSLRMPTKKCSGCRGAGERGRQPEPV
jgi:hypothetical protein